MRGQESSRRKREVAHAVVLTSSSYKKELESARTNQLAKTPKLGKRQRAADSGPKIRTHASITKKVKNPKVHSAHKLLLIMMTLFHVCTAVTCTVTLLNLSRPGQWAHIGWMCCMVPVTVNTV